MEDRSVISVVMEQYIKMRREKGHTVEADVKFNSEGQLVRAATAIIEADSEGWTMEDRLEWLATQNYDWDEAWLARKMVDSPKNRLKVGISLLIAELERVMYLENQRIENNDSSTASNAGDPESNG